MKLSGILHTHRQTQKVQYTMVAKTIEKYRITDGKRYYDLCSPTRSLILDQNSSISMTPLANKCGNSFVAAYGVFEYEEEKFLVTDPFGGESFHLFLERKSKKIVDPLTPLPIQEMLPFLKDIIGALIKLKTNNTDLNSHTVLVDASGTIMQGGIICLPKNLSLPANFFPPHPYNISKEENYFEALVLIILQSLSLRFLLSFPREKQSKKHYQSVLEKHLKHQTVIDIFEKFIQDKPNFGFYKIKIYPILEQLLEANIDLGDLKDFCQNVENDLQATSANEKSLGETSRLNIATKIFLYDYMIVCYNCRKNFSFPPSLLGLRSLCPHCSKEIELPTDPKEKICNSCEEKFSSELTNCAKCHKEEIEQEENEEIEQQVEFDLPIISLNETEENSEIKIKEIDEVSKTNINVSPWEDVYEEIGPKSDQKTINLDKTMVNNFSYHRGRHQLFVAVFFIFLLYTLFSFEVPKAKKTGPSLVIIDDPQKNVPSPAVPTPEPVKENSLVAKICKKICQSRAPNQKKLNRYLRELAINQNHLEKDGDFWHLIGRLYFYKLALDRKQKIFRLSRVKRIQQEAFTALSQAKKLYKTSAKKPKITITVAKWMPEFFLFQQDGAVYYDSIDKVIHDINSIEKKISSVWEN